MYYLSLSRVFLMDFCFCFDFIQNCYWRLWAWFDREYEMKMLLSVSASFRLEVKQKLGVRSNALFNHAVPVIYLYHKAPEGRVNAPKVNRTHAEPVWKCTCISVSRPLPNLFQSVPKQTVLYFDGCLNANPYCAPLIFTMYVAPRSRGVSLWGILNGYLGGTLWYAFHKSAWTLWLTKRTTMAQYVVERHITGQYGSLPRACERSLVSTGLCFPFHSTDLSSKSTHALHKVWTLLFH